MMTDEERARAFVERVREEIDPECRVEFQGDDVLFTFQVKGGPGKFDFQVSQLTYGWMTLCPYADEDDDPVGWAEQARGIADRVWEILRAQVDKTRAEHEDRARVGELIGSMRLDGEGLAKALKDMTEALEAVKLAGPSRGILRGSETRTWTNPGYGTTTTSKGITGLRAGGPEITIKNAAGDTIWVDRGSDGVWRERT